ncbi:hypothetical protein MUN88_05870 [Gracilibacillus caseinilyticus]|uniref:PQQ-like domain-containing protein n=1 Tax=Gracilibacillus caseinilyticus TaxID=2932256 RepID=A0ABY4F0I6_9BACI|nr:hypothetical protein [Gracilibacillus caseinilyticus]UOQ49607.1 hypothetical protein MUN88_05870 [Gracilibacillus caseinilyticus]
MRLFKIVLTTVFFFMCWHAGLNVTHATASEAPDVAWQKSLEEAGTVKEKVKNGFLFAKLEDDKIIIQKTGVSGEVQPVTSVPNPDLDSLNAFTRTDNGDYVMAGLVRNQDAPFNKIHFLKVSKSGEILWERKSDKLSKNTKGELVQTDDGYYYSNTLPVSNQQSQNEDILLMKLNESGECIWTKSLGGDYRDSANDLLPNEDGGVLLAGTWIKRPGDWSTEDADAYLASFQSDGTMKWELKHETGAYTSISAIERDNNGHIIVAGYDGSVNYYPNVDINGYVFSVDQDANLLWEKRLPVEQKNSTFSDIQLTRDGNFLLTGYVNYQAINAGMYDSDLYVTKINRNGETIWDKLVQEDNNPLEGTSIQETCGNAALIITNKDTDRYITKLEPHHP